NGAPSGGLVDVDLDAPEALAVCDSFLPRTNLVFGRPSTPRAHREYRVQGEPARTAQFRDTDGTMLVELRCTGSQTLGRAAPTQTVSGSALTAWVSRCSSTPGTLGPRWPRSPHAPSSPGIGRRSRGTATRSRTPSPVFCSAVASTRSLSRRLSG